jgi:uncharacterized protein YcaQ
MTAMTRTLETVSVDEARTLFLGAQGMLDRTDRGVTARAVLQEITRLGFVQLDSINIVERAHHHILYTRMHAYKPATLDTLQRKGEIFEHWTHDASVLPAAWFPHWRHRFGRVAWDAWLRSRIGPDPTRTLDAVLERVRREGALRARDFEHDGSKSGQWWDWKPAKAALEYWWRRGELAVPRRERFEKVYDLTERVLPGVHAAPAPDAGTHLDWACRGALERLGVATPKEIGAFWNLHKAAEAASWCAAAAARGEVVPLKMEVANGGRAAPVSYALPDWRERVESAAPAPADVRVLSPFDPIIRDRARALRLFGFDYRFEAFVPGPKRVHGYYVLPIMRGDRMIGRLDPRLDRGAGVLHVRKVWWEPKVRATKRLRAELGECLERYSAFAGAGAVSVSW